MEFNAEQQTALTSEARNLLVLAGAGTGKTRTIIGRARHLLATGVSPKRIVIVTFTRRAASEIRGRLIKAAGEDAATVVTGTFHNFCLRIMRSRQRWFGFTDLTVMDRDDQLQLMKLARGEIVGKDSSIAKAAQLVSFYSYARNTNQPPRKYLEKFAELDPPAVEIVLKIFAKYKERKLAGSYFDYDDILHRFAKVLHDSDEVRRKVAQQFDHVLVDEMQDTNPLQWLILESLAEYAHLFCVGDDAQSIYAFRGADFKNVHSFNSRLPNSETLKLEQNYRSTQPILDLANWLLEVSDLKYEKRLRAVRGAGDKPQLLDFENEYDEAEWIVGRIMKRHAEGARWDDHMVLCRSAYVARPVEGLLIERKIPYRFVGGIGLLQMAHVRDLLSVLRVAVNYRDELAWMRYLTLWPRIGEVTAAKMVCKIVSTSSSSEAASVLDEAVGKRTEIAEAVHLVARQQRAPSEAIQQLTQNLEPLFETRYENWESRSKDFRLLGKLAAKHQDVATFLETYTLDPMSASEASPSEGDDIVTLITVHSAKGTESKACYVVGVQPGNYPHTRSLDDAEAIEEERRVLYVALTRAEDELVLTRHFSRGPARVSWNAPVQTHYFLERLPKTLVDSKSLFGSLYDVSWDDDYIG
ncbi:ATP-dependent helicase [Aureliella helgolandensis]|uniref:DNA 3'-5' helicase n=1 Tax=Aureliella helgolandensis TaxID=2527968 RepID=A0A518GEZ5_9BACT|nr:ATP-dependent helicase [Aureliella helgolandensis]QDV27169.1 ATP-dependent DNA helicase UvrD1 [Aureliella helgolandensis]